jgi:predicted outer membrane repeat protein
VVPVATLIFTANSSSAATIRVPADAPTIQAGIDAAAAGDSVLVAPGTYTGPGNKDLDFNGKDIVLTSESGAASTVIDCQYNGRGFIFHGGEPPSAIVEGFTVQWGGVQGPGGAVQIQTAEPTIRGCVFIDNRSWDGFGGAVACISNSRPTIADCMFVRNITVGPGGALYSGGLQAVVRDCVFDSNQGTGGGAIFVSDGTLLVTGSTFRNNRMEFQQGSEGAVFAYQSTLILEGCTLLRNRFGAVVVSSGDAEVRGCTFVENDGETFGYIVGSGLTVGGGSFAKIENCIFAFGTYGPAIMNLQGQGCAASCTDIFGNAGGDWVDCVEGQNGINGNISADPLFCDRAQDDLSLDERSPCAPDNSGACSLIGAHGVGCGTTAVNPTTWGHLKSMWQEGRAVRR